MKNNQLRIIIIAVLCILGLYVLVRNSHFDKAYLTHTSSETPCINCNESKDRTIPSIESDGVSLNLNITISNYDKNLCNLKDIIYTDSMYLIFKYPLSYCGDCVNRICQDMEQLKDSIPCINTMIIASGGSIREMKVKMHPYKDIFPVYLILDNDMGLPIDKSNIPYMIFVNDGKTSKHTIVLSPNSTELLKDYIYTLSKRYCK